MRKLWLIFALWPAMAFAQTTPFSGQPTSATDWTCVGVVPCTTWPMPANPGQGGSYADPTWGTTTWELSISSHNTDGHVIPTYSRVQAYSSDNKYMFLTEAGGASFTDLYDATTTPPTPINRIVMSDGTLVNAYSGDVYWANTNPTRIYYIPWGYYPTDVQLRYFDISGCTTSSCVLTPVTVHDFAADNVGGTGHACTSDSYFPGGAGIAGTVIETGFGAQGGMFDSTDTYFSFMCNIGNGSGQGSVDFIRYNRQTDTVMKQQKWYTIGGKTAPTDFYVWNNPPGAQGYNMVRMNQHPDARYITLLWQDTCGINPAVWYVGCGTAAYDPNYNFLGPISIADYHQDNGFDINGIPTSVIDGTPTGFASDYWSLEVVNLNTLSTTAITSKQLQLPCGVAYGGPGCTAPFLGAKSNHISMTGTWSSLPGYALVSYLTLAGSTSSTQVSLPVPTTLGTAVTTIGVNTVTPGTMANIGVGTQQVIDCGSSFSCNTSAAETVTVTGVTGSTFTATFAKTHTSSATVGNITVGDTGPYALENIAVKIDTTATTGSNASVWRLSRAMSIRDADYNAEPHTTVNRDWTAYVWGGNWNTDNGPDDAYWTQLTVSGTRRQITVTKAGTGDGATTPGSGPYIQGNSYTFTGTPFSGSTGPTWSGTCGATGISSTVTVTPSTSDCTVIATYGIISSYVLTVSASGSGLGTFSGTNCVLGSTSYPAGTPYSCTATATSGNFASWLGSTCGGTAGGNVYSGTMPTTNCTVNAVFSSKTLTTITLSPASVSIPVNTGTQQFTPTCTYSDSTQDGCAAAGGVTWAPTTGNIATVNGSGLATAGSQVGSITVTATNGSIHGTASLTTYTTGSASYVQQGPFCIRGCNIK